MSLGMAAPGVVFKGTVVPDGVGVVPVVVAPKGVVVLVGVVVPEGFVTAPEGDILPPGADILEGAVEAGAAYRRELLIKIAPQITILNFCIKTPLKSEAHHR